MCILEDVIDLFSFYNITVSYIVIEIFIHKVKETHRTDIYRSFVIG